MAATSIKKSGIDPTTSATKGTFSFWVKFSKVRTDGNDYFIFSSYDDGNSRMHIKLDGSGCLDINERISSSVSINLITTRKLKDTFGWYHIVVAIDSTQSTNTDRVKVYINGTQETSFSQNTYPTQNEDIHALQGNKVHYLGCYGGNVNSASYCLDGCMSHCHFADGQQYAASVFGETDTTTGEWKIKTSPTVTYGNNGWFVLKDGNSLTNHAGNSAGNFVLDTGTLTNTEDNPSNVFATFNSSAGADTMAVNTTFSNGNTTVVNSGTVYNPYGSTLGARAGKYYAEFKAHAAMGDGMVGIFGKIGVASNAITTQATQYAWYNAGSGKIKENSSTTVDAVGNYTTNDIIGIAMDLDNNKLYFHKNGTYISNGTGTGNPSSGTNGISITDPDDTVLGFYFMTAMDWGGGTRGNWSANFGNGYFGTTAISSEGSNASGLGKFEYDVPTGYTALCTKGLNE